MSASETPKMDERECTRCHVTKPLNQENFTRVGANRYTNGLNRDGTCKYTKICNDCTRLRQRATLDAQALKREEYHAWRAAQELTASEQLLKNAGRNQSEVVDSASDIAQRANIDP